MKVSQSVYCFTTSISHGVENYLPRLWGTGISDAIFLLYTILHLTFWDALFLLAKNIFLVNFSSVNMKSM